MSTPAVTVLPTAVEIIATGWADRVREAAKRDGNAIQAGAGNTIEAQSINSGLFGAILLPTGGAAFATAEDRDQVLQKIIAP